MARGDALMARGQLSRGSTRKVQPISKPKNADDRFLIKLQEGDLDSFSIQDWYRYIWIKCREHSLRNVSSTHPNNAVLKSILTNYSSGELKQMIDFIFDSGQDSFDYRSGNVILAFSKKWLDFTYNQAMRWDGKPNTYTSKESRIKTERTSKLRRREYSTNETKEKKPKDTVILGGGVTL